MTCLKTQNRSLGATEFPIRSSVALLGRNPDCEIHLNNSSVSRRHARIFHDERGFTIEDLQSSNGTLLNGEALTERKRLFNGDAIQICDLDFTFESRRPEAQRPSGKFLNKRIDLAVVTDDSQERPINVTSQIDLRQVMQTRPLPGPAGDYIGQIRALQTKVDVMLQMMKNLGKVIDSDGLLPEFLTNLLKLFPQADYSCILSPDPVTEMLELVDFKARDRSGTEPFRISRTVPEMVFERRTAILSDDLQEDTRFNASDSLLHSRICSLMAVPIIEQTSQTPIGVIQLDSRSSGRPFTDVDLDLLVSIANQIAVYHENLRFQDIRRKEQMLSQEMTVAHQVQKGFLPNCQPQSESYTFYDFYQPAKFLGGDYFDYIPLPDGRIAVVLADVSGKGISAALLMAKLSSEVRFSLLTEKTLPEAMKRLNGVYCDRMWQNRFITLALAVLDPATDTLSLLNAGHLFPIRRSPGGIVEEIGEGRQGFPIGVMPDADYEEISIELGPGDIVLLMSDGITDAMNAQGDYFELARVTKLLQDEKSNVVTALGDTLIQSVQAFVGTTPQSDDQCLVILGRSECPGSTVS